MSKFSAVAVAILSLALGSAAHAGPVNLITNGDFSAGLTGFSSDYTLGGDSMDEGVLNVGTNPTQFHPLWDNFTNTSNMLIVNGSTSSTPATVWSETISLTKGAKYTYTGSVTSIYGDSPADLEAVATIGGKDYVFGTLQLLGGSSTPQWQTMTGTLTSPFSGEVTLKLIDLNTASSGNDFALTNLSLTSAVPEPKSYTLALAGLAALGFVMRRRQPGA